MSSRLSYLGLETTNFTISQACWELIAPSTRRIVIREIQIIQKTATAQTLGLGRPAAIGITPTAPVTAVRGDPADNTSSVTGALAWATSPTAPAAYIAKWTSSANVGATVTWYFQDGLVLSASGTLVLFNLTAAVAVEVNVRFEE